MRRNILKTAALAVCLLILSIAVIQVGAALYLSRARPPVHPADLVLVFPGDPERVVTGCKVVQAGYAPNLLVVNDTAAALQKIMDRQGVTAGVRPLAGGRSRSSFEDAYNSARAISEHRFRSVILVTSGYHLPRSYFLLKTFLIGSGYDVSIQCYPAEAKTKMGIARRLQLYYNEIVKFWGSSAEMLGYFLTDRLPLDSPGTSSFRAFLKAHVLFKI